MSSHNTSLTNPSQRATTYLETVLKDGSTTEDITIIDNALVERTQEKINVQNELQQTVDTALLDEPIETQTVHEARAEAPMLEYTPESRTTRLLLITKDVSILQEGSIAYRRIMDQQYLFQEIHIIVCTYNNGKAESPILRLFDNVWIYATNSSSWWRLSYDAYRLAETQLIFNDNFRADVIVAEDAFETGLVGLFLSRKYARAFQLHVYEDFFDQEYVNTLAHPILYEWSVRYILGRVQSIRTRTELQRQAIVAQRPELEQYVAVLPSYYNLDVWRDMQPTFNLHERYPQFKFIILAISSMKTVSHTDAVIMGVAKMLRRYPTIGLVILGSGPLRTDLERNAIALGLQNQIEFEPMPTEVISYMKSANVFIHLSEDSDEDEYILEAAVSRIPIISYTTGLAGALFKDGKSAYLCQFGDTECVGNSVNRYLNDNQDRIRFALNAYDVIFERIEQDYGAYIRAYHESIEQCLAQVS